MKDDGGVWVRRPLASLATVFTDGDWIESKDQSASGIRLVQTGNVGEGEFKDRSAKARYIDLPTFERLKCFEVHPGDILVSRLPDPVGRSCVVPDQGERMITAVDCSVVRVDKSVMDERFLVYYTQSESYLRAVDERCTGTTRRRISRSNLGLVEIPVPPVEEQRQIVAILDQAFAFLDRARAHAETNLADATILFDTELRAAFEQIAIGAESLKFDQLCEAITPRAKIKRKEYLGDGRFPIVSQEAEKVSGYWNDPGALLGLNAPVVVFGDHTRCLKYIDFDFVVGADGTKVLKPRQGVSAAYLYYGLRSQPIKGGGYARHFKFLRESSLPDIPLDKQDQLTNRLVELEGRCRQLAQSYELKLEELAALRQSLLQQAFSGQLT